MDMNGISFSETAASRLKPPMMMTAAVTKMLDDYGVPPEMIAFDDFGG